MQLGEIAGAREVVLFHHDPTRTDDEVMALAGRLRREAALPIEPAIEGATIQL